MTRTAEQITASAEPHVAEFIATLNLDWPHHVKAAMIAAGDDLQTIHAIRAAAVTAGATLDVHGDRRYSDDLSQWTLRWPSIQQDLRYSYGWQLTDYSGGDA